MYSGRFPTVYCLSAYWKMNVTNIIIIIIIFIIIIILLPIMGAVRVAWPAVYLFYQLEEPGARGTSYLFLAYTALVAVCEIKISSALFDLIYFHCP
jgi:hypothetical protein